ncbi:MAG: hypothetical protein LBR89_03465 [Holosporales bacterium]|jgi:hypothetical protein|nr:hypothetical protein [Holosporales bacterium]
MPNYGAFVTLTALLTLLTGCGGYKVMVPTVALKKVTVVAQKEANKEMVTTVHFVFPKTETLAEEIRKMDAVAYFAAFADIKASHPNDIEIVSIEAVPGISTSQKIQLEDFNSQAAIVYARYDDSIPGAHREELKKRCSKVIISLGRTSFGVAY